jgi:hypothetical protein
LNIEEASFSAVYLVAQSEHANFQRLPPETTEELGDTLSKEHSQLSTSGYGGKGRHNGFRKWEII